jgi:hypothetical protein
MRPTFFEKGSDRMNGMVRQRIDRGMMMAAIFVLMPTLTAHGSDVRTLTVSKAFSLSVNQDSLIRSGSWVVVSPFSPYQGRLISVTLDTRFTVSGFATKDPLNPYPFYDQELVMDYNVGLGWDNWIAMSDNGGMPISRHFSFTLTPESYVSFAGPSAPRYQTKFAARFFPYGGGTQYAGRLNGEISLILTYDAAAAIPTPEPATWVSAAVGVAMLTGAGWRRSRRGERRLGSDASAIG